jgi:hypothetical protein
VADPQNEVEMKLRLLITESCDRDCAGCCNKQWDLAGLEVETDFSQYDEILLTGGEPMLNPDKVIKLAKRIRDESAAKIYVYTAKVDDIRATLDVLRVTDGITLTLHEQSDVPDFFRLSETLFMIGPIEGKSLRLNIFKGISVSVPMRYWQVKDDIEWIKDCPLPKDEVFKRLESSWDRAVRELLEGNKAVWKKLSDM